MGGYLIEMMYSMATPIAAISPRLFVPQPKWIMMLVGGEFGGPGMYMHHYRMGRGLARWVPPSVYATVNCVGWKRRDQAFGFCLAPVSFVLWYVCRICPWMG